MLTKTLVAPAAALLLAATLSHASTPQTVPCAARPDEPDSVAEILKLEKQWTQAYATGHSDFMECLYAPGFVYVSADGKLHDRVHDIASSAKNVGKPYKPPAQAWVTEVLMHPGYAIATSAKAGVKHGLRFTDIYAYDGHRWHAIFAQDTNF